MKSLFSPALGFGCYNNSVHNYKKHTKTFTVFHLVLCLALATRATNGASDEGRYCRWAHVNVYVCVLFFMLFRHMWISSSFIIQSRYTGHYLPTLAEMSPCGELHWSCGWCSGSCSQGQATSSPCSHRTSCTNSRRSHLSDPWLLWGHQHPQCDTHPCWGPS